MKTRLLLATTFAALLAFGAHAGPIQDGENDIGGVYALYRKALFSTNQKDAALARQDLDALTSRWNDLAARWARQAPAHYASDPELPATFSRVGVALAAAAGKLASGDNPGAHDALEPIREALQEMRARNGVASFSDDMNEYHTAMEHVAERYGAASSFDFGAMREDAAVLAHLAARMGARAPAGLRAAPDFKDLFGKLEQSVAALLTAARAQDADAARKAATALKRPYSQFFLKFG